MANQPTNHTSPPREKPILLGYVVQRRGPNGRMEISVRWKRLLGTFFLLIVLGWFAMAGALYFHFKYNKEFEDVSYTKMLTLLPFGLKEHRVDMGNYHVEKGLAHFKEGNYNHGLRLLRLGLARAPANLEGRLTLASFYEFAYKRHDIAADHLLEGLKHGGIEDQNYLKQTLTALLRYQMDEAIQDIADKYLPEEPELTEINRTLAFGAANANYLRGNYDRADDYLTSYQLLASPEGTLLASRISWDRGNKAFAIATLERFISQFPNSESLLIQLSAYHRELGQIDEARRYAILRNVIAPLSAGPRLELLYIYNQSGDTEREQREIKSMLQQFRDDEDALKALASFASKTGNIDLARLTYEEALENEFNIASFALLLIEAHLADKEYEGALNFSEELLKERPDWLTQKWGIFSSLRAVASYGINRPDLGEIHLQHFIDAPNIQPQTYLAVAKQFSEIGQHQQARKVLMVAYQNAETNQKVLSELIRTELALGNTEDLDRLLTRLLEMRRPDTDLLMEAYHKLGSDQYIFTSGRQDLLLQLSSILRKNSQALPKQGEG